MSTSRLERLAPLTGVLFAIVIFAGVFTGGETPDAGDSPARVVTYFATHRSEAELSSLLFAIGFLIFLFFAASLRSFLRRTEGAEGLAALALAGAVVMTGGALLASTIEYALAHELHNLTPAGAQILNLLSNEVGLVMLVGGGFVLMVASGLAILRGAPVPRWLGWAAIAIGILALVLPIAFIALLLLLIWILVTSIFIYRRQASPASGGVTPGVDEGRLAASS
jgi:preprotein translocase subunit YajC